MIVPGLVRMITLWVRKTPGWCSVSAIMAAPGALLDRYHVVCCNCGRIAEVDAGGVQELLAAVGSGTGFSFAGHSLTLAGMCDRCAPAAVRPG